MFRNIIKLRKGFAALSRQCELATQKTCVSKQTGGDARRPYKRTPVPGRIKNKTQLTGAGLSHKGRGILPVSSNVVLTCMGHLSRHKGFKLSLCVLNSYFH